MRLEPYPLPADLVLLARNKVALAPESDYQGEGIFTFIATFENRDRPSWVIGAGSTPGDAVAALYRRLGDMAEPPPPPPLPRRHG